MWRGSKHPRDSGRGGGEWQQRGRDDDYKVTLESKGRGYGGNSSNIDASSLPSSSTTWRRRGSASVHSNRRTERDAPSSARDRGCSDRFHDRRHEGKRYVDIHNVDRLGGKTKIDDRSDTSSRVQRMLDMLKAEGVDISSLNFPQAPVTVTAPLQVPSIEISAMSTSCVRSDDDNASDEARDDVDDDSGDAVVGPQLMPASMNYVSINAAFLDPLPEPEDLSDDDGCERSNSRSSASPSPPPHLPIRAKPSDNNMKDLDNSNVSNNNSKYSNNSSDLGGASSVEGVRSSALTGCRSVDCYEKLNKIDEGTYGVVYRARDRRTSEIVALKQVKLPPEQCREGFPLTSLREINILLSLQHPGVIDVREIVMGSSDDMVFMVMEYMDHDLRALMDKLPQNFFIAEVKCLLRQLLSATAYLHDRWVLHRDLKSANLLFNNNGQLKICDFGLARRYADPLKSFTPIVVTLWYRAPELLLGTTSYSTAVDMWSVGCIFAEMLQREPLWQGRDEMSQIIKIASILGAPNERVWPDIVNLPVAKKVSFTRASREMEPFERLRQIFPPTSYTGGPYLTEAGFDLLKRFFCWDPAQRITATEALQHPWFSEAPLAQDDYRMPIFPSTNESAEARKRRKRTLEELLEKERAAFYQR